MAKVAKLFRGQGYTPTRTQWLAQSEHGSWWSRETTESGKTVHRWCPAHPPKPPTFEARYEVRDGRFVRVGSQAIDKKRLESLRPGCVQGEMNLLIPVALDGPRIVLPMTKEERERVEQAKALGKAAERTNLTNADLGKRIRTL